MPTPLVEPKCPHCKGTEISATTRTRAGVKFALIYCSTCGAILGAASKSE